MGCWPGACLLGLILRFPRLLVRMFPRQSPKAVTKAEVLRHIPKSDFPRIVPPKEVRGVPSNSVRMVPMRYEYVKGRSEAVWSFRRVPKRLSLRVPRLEG